MKGGAIPSTCSIVKCCQANTERWDTAILGYSLWAFRHIVDLKDTHALGLQQWQRGHSAGSCTI